MMRLMTIRQHMATMQRTSEAEGVFSPACSGVAEPNAEEVPEPPSWWAWPLMPAEPGLSSGCPGDVDGFDCCCGPASPVPCC